MTEETIVSHIEKLLEESKVSGEDIDIQYLKNAAFSQKRFEKIQEAFEKSHEKNGDYRLAPVKYSLGFSYSYLEVRLARLFIQDEK